MAIKRFAVLMDEDLHREFFLAFPHPGSRSALIRHIIRGIIKADRLKKNSWNWEEPSEEITEDVLKRLEEVDI